MSVGSIDGRGVARGDRFAVAEHGDPIAHGEHLLETVGNVDDAAALRAQPADDAEQALDLVRPSATPSARP